MTNTVTVNVKKTDGWKPVTTGTAGVFSASNSCVYTISDMQPNATEHGHRLSNGDLEFYVLKANETLYVKSPDDTDVFFSNSGVGFGAEWLRGKSVGEKAEPIQNYIEVNCKTGDQWGLSTYEPNLPASTGVKYLLFTTGDKPIALKGRIYSFDGLGVQVTTYRNPVVTGGTITDVTNDIVYNMNDRNPSVLLSKVEVLTTPTFQTKGEKWVKPRTFLGDAQTGVNNHTTVDPDLSGLELWFRENTTYLIEVLTIDPSDDQRYSLFATFYEGFPDLP
jgi:hypothetical protein